MDAIVLYPINNELIINLIEHIKEQEWETAFT